MNSFVTVVGAGLAGCEAAWQLAKRGIDVTLCEMKPIKRSPAHTMDSFAELVCSNSLKAEHTTNASGLLKAEMRMLDSLILRAAEKTRVPAGGALAVDRNTFSKAVTDEIARHPRVHVVHSVISELPPPPYIVATGPLTEDSLAQALKQLPGFSALHFFDAAAPIVTKDSLDMSKVYAASRYERGADYLNSPMTKQEYDAFYDALVSAELAPVDEFEKKLVFEGCLAVEILASRGRQTLAFGPLKPVGLIDPNTGKRPYANVQLRQDDEAGELYNLVGFQTRLKWGEQKRVFSMIPGLERAEFVRYGVMHRNTYLNSPDVLEGNFARKGSPYERFAGQLTGVEGYMESAASGLVAGVALAARMLGKPEPDFGRKTIMGALSKYVCAPNTDFQPMNANFGILEAPETRIRNKREKYECMADRALADMKTIIDTYGL